ncbi:MAG: TonB-dependent receptor [Tannerella sp.]|nr:TonB-dependent receptor [Tannerella sp.]
MKNDSVVSVRFLYLYLFFLFIPLGMAAQTVVTGTVTDKNGETLIGVSVVEKGAANGVATGIDGDYSLKVASDATLQFSYIGYVSLSIPVQGQTRIDVIMEEDAQALEEVVVIGYGTQRREAVTGSVASMRGDVLREVQTGNITSALAGRVAGVQLSQTNSKPGADMQIRIRGTRSFSADNNPLVVLDGIPFAGTIGDINPENIRSIDILKDASATAIYGSRGANGVIMLTTNKGAIGQKPGVTYNVHAGAKTLYHRYPMMTGDELYALRKAAGMYKDTAGNPSMGADEAQGNNTDWQDLMFGSGMVMSHDVGVSNGTETGSYTLGGGYYTDRSLLPGQNYSRISLRANIDQMFGKYLRFGLTSNSNYNLTNGQSIGMYNTLAVSPLVNPWNTDGTWKTRVSAVADANAWAYSKEAIESLGDKYADNQRGYASYNSLYGEVKIPGVEGLTYRLNLGLNLRASNRGRYQGAGVFSDTPTAASTGSLDKRLTTQWVVENLLTYDKSFGKHHFNLTGLYSEEQTRYDRSYVSALNIPSDHFQYWNLGQAEKSDVTVDPKEQIFEESALKSVMGRVMYDYDSRYMFSVAVRSDASSRLAPGHQWHTYPAISAGWNIARESFMESVDLIDNLKLRLGWGQTSNQAVDIYATLGSLNTRPYNFGTSTATGFYVSEVPNPELDWEYSITSNFGLDFSLLKNRLSGSIEYYVINTDKILMEVPLPSTAGVGSYWANVGKSQNKGLEIALNGVILENKDGWTWEAGLNFYTNRNKVVELASGQDREESMSLFTGHPINSIYDYEKIGLWQEGENIEDYEDGGHVGMIKVKYTGEYDANGKPVRKIGADDRQIISADPKWQGGFNTRIAYRNLDLNIIGTYQHGGILVSSLHAANGYLNMLTGRRGNVKVDYWTPQNTDAKYPAPAPPQSGDNQKYGSTLGYFSASYLKVGQITLGYNFDRDADWFKKSGIAGARLYFTLQNAFVLFSPFSGETGLDPVTNSYGNENAAVTTSLPYRASTMLTVGTNTPQTRNFLFGLNLSF